VDLQNSYPSFQKRNAEVIAVAVQDVDGAQRVAQATGASFPLLADPDHKVADAYQVYNLLGDGVATPSVFIIGRTGSIVWSYIGQNAGDRPSAETVLSHLPGDD
jgi:peroxiredoxin